MERADFKKVIKIMSGWRIDKRKGNYRLPNGEKLSGYVCTIMGKFLHNNGADDEKYDYLKQSERIEKLVKEMIY